MLDQRREVSVQPEPGTDDGEHRLDARDGKLARVENGNDLSRVAVLSQVGLDLGGDVPGEVFEERGAWAEGAELFMPPCRDMRARGEEAQLLRRGGFLAGLPDIAIQSKGVSQKC